MGYVPSLGLLEIESIARGMVCADAMVKRAVVRLDQAQAVTPGKFIIVVSGGEEDVAQALDAGRELTGDTLIDELYLPLADPQLVPAVRGESPKQELDAVGIVETRSVAASIVSADRAVKASDVFIVRMRLARGLGGKAFFVITGDLHQVQSGVEAAVSRGDTGMIQRTEIIPNPHPDFWASIARS